MTKLMTRGLNPYQLSIAYKELLKLTEGTEIARDREKLRSILKDVYNKNYPNSFMPIDEKDTTVSSIYNNYGRIEELANSLEIDTIDDLLEIIKKGAESK